MQRHIVISFVSFYSVVFLLSVVGNIAVLRTCYRTMKRRPSSIKGFIANLAFSDLAFTLLSILNSINFAWTWLGGTVTCKLQGFLVEACYNTSIMTLAAISFERRKAVVTPFKTRTGDSDGASKKLLAIWMASLMTGCPLLYAYDVHMDASGSLVCNNASFGVLGKQVYYSFHAVCIFLVPLTYMIYAQSTIFHTLRSRVVPTQSITTTMSSLQHQKIGKTLAALTVAFTVCWAPFIIVRTLMYFQLMDAGYLWRACQILVLLNTVLDPILYGIYGENVKGFCQHFFGCCRHPTCF